MHIQYSLILVCMVRLSMSNIPLQCHTVEPYHCEQNTELALVFP